MQIHWQENNTDSNSNTDSKFPDQMDQEMRKWVAIQHKVCSRKLRFAMTEFVIDSDLFVNCRNFLQVRNSISALRKQVITRDLGLSDQKEENVS